MLTVVLGGAFDPPHSEHIKMVELAVSVLKADRLVLVPTFLPPHKSEGFLSFYDRKKLLELAFCNFIVPVIIDEIENDRKKDNYTHEVLPILKEKYGNIVYLIGGDSLKFFPTWRQPQDIVKCCPIAVVERKGYPNIQSMAETIGKQFDCEFILLDSDLQDISSAVVKAKLLLGMKTRELEPQVQQYIDENHLYSEYNDIVSRLRCVESPELFEHSQFVVLNALELNSKHNLKLDFRKVFLAALLHDNAKERPSIDGLNVPLDSIDTPVLHQFLGAVKATRDFGIVDLEILDAIRFHTTAKADMSTLEKLIYTADSLSADRKYEPIPRLRQLAYENFDLGFKSILKYTYLKVIAKGKGIYPLTAEAAKFYLNKEN